MNEEEKKALKVINARTRRLLDELEIEKEDMSDEPKIAYLMQEIRANKTILNLVEKLQKENEELKERIREHTLLISPYYVKENFIPIQRIENLIKELKQDDINMTRKYKEKNNITGELLGIDKVRVRAYREKTREIKEKLQKLLSD